MSLHLAENGQNYIKVKVPSAGDTTQQLELSYKREGKNIRR